MTARQNWSLSRLTEPERADSDFKKFWNLHFYQESWKNTLSWRNLEFLLQPVWSRQCPCFRRISHGMFWSFSAKFCSDWVWRCFGIYEELLVSLIWLEKVCIESPWAYQSRKSWDVSMWSKLEKFNISEYAVEAAPLQRPMAKISRSATSASRFLSSEFLAWRNCSASGCLRGSLGSAILPMIQLRARIISSRLSLVIFLTNLMSSLNVFDFFDFDIEASYLKPSKATTAFSSVLLVLGFLLISRK